MENRGCCTCPDGLCAGISALLLTWSGDRDFASERDLTSYERWHSGFSPESWSKGDSDGEAQLCWRIVLYDEFEPGKAYGPLAFNIANEGPVVNGVMYRSFGGNNSGSQFTSRYPGFGLSGSNQYAGSDPDENEWKFIGAHKEYDNLGVEIESTPYTWRLELFSYRKGAGCGECGSFTKRRQTDDDGNFILGREGVRVVDTNVDDAADVLWMGDTVQGPLPDGKEVKLPVILNAEGYITTSKLVPFTGFCAAEFGPWHDCSHHWQIGNANPNYDAEQGIPGYLSPHGFPEAGQLNLENVECLHLKSGPFSMIGRRNLGKNTDNRIVWFENLGGGMLNFDYDPDIYTPDVSTIRDWLLEGSKTLIVEPYYTGRITQSRHVPQQIGINFGFGFGYIDQSTPLAMPPADPYDGLTTAALIQDGIQHTNRIWSALGLSSSLATTFPSYGAGLPLFTSSGSPTAESSSVSLSPNVQVATEAVQVLSGGDLVSGFADMSLTGFQYHLNLSGDVILDGRIRMPTRPWKFQDLSHPNRYAVSPDRFTFCGSETIGTSEVVVCSSPVHATIQRNALRRSLD